MNLSPLRFIFCLALVSVSARALAYDPHDVVVRTGAVMGNYKGKDLSSGSYNTDINVEGEMWIYRNSREAWVVKGLLAHDSSLGRTRMLSFGAGQRYFLYSEGMISESVQGNDSVRIKPNFGVYAGWNLNVGQFLLLPFGSVLSSYATTADAEAVLGVRKVLNSQFSIDAALSYSYGTSVLSSTSVSATMMKAMVGVGFSF